MNDWNTCDDEKYLKTLNPTNFGFIETRNDVVDEQAEREHRAREKDRNDKMQASLTAAISKQS